MSKIKLKKLFETLSKEEIIEAVLDMYSSRKEAKAYWDYFLDPDCLKMLEKAKKGIHAAFYTRGENSHPRRRPRFKEGNKVVAEFKLLPPDIESLAELMTYYWEQCVEYLTDMWRVSDATLSSSKLVLMRLTDFLHNNQLDERFSIRINCSAEKLRLQKPRIYKSLFSD